MATFQAITPDVGTKTTPAAYVAFRTFLGAIEALGQGVPKRIDRTMWRSQSGIVQSQIMMALRFFNLVDEEDRPTPALHRLVDSPEDKRREQIAALLLYAYHDIIEHDLTKTTPKMLEEAMEQYHVSGDTKRKAITFFLQAARFAELPMHPLLSGAIRNTSQTRKRRAKTRDMESTLDGRDTANDALARPTGTQLKAVQLRSGGLITVTVDVDVFAMSPEDRTFVFGVIDTLQKYEKGNQ